MHGLGLFYCDNAVFGNFFHSVCNKLANFLVTCRNCSYVCDLFLSADCLAHFLNCFYCCISCFFHSFTKDDRVCSCCKVLHTFMNHSLCQNSSCCSTVACNIVCFGSNFFDQLCSHVLKSVLKLDLFCNSHTVVCDKRSAERFVKYNVSSFRSKCYSYCICKLVYTIFKCGSCFCTKFDFFCHDENSS